MKAVFVDGASLFCMGSLIGVKRISFLSLYNLLTQELGEQKRLATIPLFVLNANLTAAFKKPLTGAGFEVLTAASRDGSDDRIIIERMKALDAEKVTEIVIVSTDRDYTPVLKFKACEGVRNIYWVGTEQLDHNSRSSIGTDLRCLLKQQGYHFVELANFKSRLTYEEEFRPGGTPPPDGALVPAAL